MAWDRDHLKGLNPAKALAVKLASPVEAAITAIVHGHRPGWVSGGSTPNNQYPVAGALNFGDVALNLGIVKSAAELLAGATDADGDTLTVVSVTVGVGCTVSGTGPWTITPTATGAGTANVTISDGRGGTVVRVLSWICFTPGLWNHAAVATSGASQILGVNRYRIFSPDGSYSSVQINNSLAGKNTKLFQFRLTVESITAGTSIIMGDDVGNDITVTGVGTHTGTWVVNGPTATIKRNSGVTDVVIRNVQLIEVNRSPVTAAAVALGSINVGAAQTITAATLLSGVTDPDGDTLTIVGYAVHTGSATITGSGPYTLMPTGAGAGTASFTISDGRGGVVTRGVTWTGVAVNTNPVAPLLALGDLTVGIGLVQSSAQLLAGATDADGDILTITSVAAVSGGTVSGTGPWTITPSVTGAGSATVVITDGRGGRVNRTVTWNGVPAGLSGGTPALAWSAPSLDDGAEITITTDGTLNFGAAPTAIVQQGFGQGWMYDQPLLTVLTGGTVMDGGIKVSQGEARRIEQIDGIRAFASRLRDPAGWAGDKGAGRHLSWDVGNLNPGDRVAVFGSYKINAPVEPLNWQIKLVRFQPDDLSTDNTGEIGLYTWRSYGYSAMRNTNGTVDSYYNVALPHVGFGWQSLAWMQEWGTDGAVNGPQITRLIGQDDYRHVQEKSQLVKTHDGLGAPRPRYLLWQDYIDNSSGTAVEPYNIDYYLTDLQAQTGSFGAVYLADAPTPELARNAIPLPTQVTPSIAWAVNEIKVRMWKQGRSWPVMYLHIYSGTTGLFLGSVNVTGTYVPPEWDEYADIIGLSRPAGSNTASRQILLTGMANSAGAVQRFRIWTKVNALPGTTMGIIGGSSVNGLIFDPDGTVRFRCGGMGSTATLRGAGPMLLTAGQRHLIEIEIAPTLARIWLDETPIGSVAGAGLKHDFSRLGDGGLPATGWQGVYYSCQYSENAAPVHEWRFDEGSGTVGADSVGSVTAAIGTGFTWVNT